MVVYLRTIQVHVIIEVNSTMVCFLIVNIRVQFEVCLRIESLENSLGLFCFSLSLFRQCLDHANSSVLSNNFGTDVYPSRSIPGGGFNPDLSRALRVDAYLLAIVRVEDKRSKYE